MNNKYSICYNEWIFDKSIKNELGLLLIISSFCMNNKECFATNEYFANLFKLDTATVSRKLKKLQKKGYISIKYIKQGCEVVSRTIRLTKMSFHDCQKSHSTNDKNVKDTITSITNTNITRYCRVELDDTTTFSKIISCFNKIGILEDSFVKNKKEFHFKLTEKTKEIIQNILNQGYTKEDIMDVIFLKYDQWIENADMNKHDMSTYYRPSTILGEKFEEYLEEARIKEIS